MIQLKQGEKILLLLHRHWIVILGKVVAALFLALIPLFLVPLEEFISSWLPEASFQPLFLLILTIYWLILLGYLIIALTEYWLDCWIITNERIIDIEQVTLFHREISEFSLDRVQDVTVRIPHILATFLHFGDITVQTAGEKNFTVRDIPHVEEAKRLILEYADKNKKAITV